MAETTRARQLQKLADTLPGANQQVQKGLEQARATQLQESIRQAPATASTQQIQQAGAQQAAAAATAAVQGLQQQQQQQVQVGQLGLQQQTRQQRGTEAGRQIALSERQQRLSTELGKIDRRLQTRLLDDQMDFKKNSAGQTLFTERQMLDFAALQAKDQDELASYIQGQQLIYKRKMQLYQEADNRFTEILQRGYIAADKPLDRASEARIRRAQRAAKIHIANIKNDASNNLAASQATESMWGMAIGGAVGFVYGGPGGAAAGAKLGGKAAPGIADALNL